MDIATGSVDVPSEAKYKQRADKLKNAQLVSTPKKTSGYSWHTLRDTTNMVILSPKEGASNNENFLGYYIPLDTVDRSMYLKYDSSLLCRSLQGILSGSEEANYFYTLPRKSNNPRVLKFTGTGSDFHDYIYNASKEKYQNHSNWLRVFTSNMLSDITYLKYKKFNRKLDKWYMSVKTWNYHDRDTLEQVATKFPETDYLLYGYDSTNESSYKTNGTEAGEAYGTIRKSQGENFFGTNYAVETWKIDYDKVYPLLKEKLGIDGFTIDEDYTKIEDIEKDSSMYKRLLLNVLYPDYNIESDTILIDNISYEIDFDNNLFSYTKGSQVLTTSLIYYNVEQVNSNGESITKQYAVFLSLDYLSINFTDEGIIEEVKDKFKQYNYKLLDMEYTRTHLNNISGLSKSTLNLTIPTNNKDYILSYKTVSDRFLYHRSDDITEISDFSASVLQHIFYQDTNTSIKYGDFNESADDSDDTLYVDDDSTEKSYSDYIDELFDYPTLDYRECNDSLLSGSIVNIQLMSLAHTFSDEQVSTQAVMFSEKLKSKYMYFPYKTNKNTTSDNLVNIPFESPDNIDTFKSTEYNFGIPLDKKSYYINDVKLYQQLEEELTELNSFYLFKVTKDDKIYYYPLLKTTIDADYSKDYQAKILPILPSVPFSFLLYQHYQIVAKTLIIYIIFPRKTNAHVYYRSKVPYNYFNQYNVHVKNYFKNLYMRVKEWDRVENPDYIDSTNKIDNTKRVSRIYKDKDHAFFCPRTYGSRKGLGYKDTYDDRNKEIEATDSVSSMFAFAKEGKMSSYFDMSAGSDGEGSTNRIINATVQPHFSFIWYLNEWARQLKILAKTPAKYCDYLASYYEITATYTTLEFVMPTRVPCSKLKTKLKIKKEPQEYISRNKIEFDEDTAEMSIYSKYTNYKYIIDFNTYCSGWKDLIIYDNRINFVNMGYPAYDRTKLKNYCKDWTITIDDIIKADYPIVFIPMTQAANMNLTSYGYKLLERYISVDNNSNSLLYIYHVYYKPEIEHIMKVYFIKNLSLKNNFDNVYTIKFVNQTYTYKDYYTTLFNLINFDSLSAEELIALYTKYINPDAIINPDIIDYTNSTDIFELEDTYAKIESSINDGVDTTDYPYVLAPCYFNVDKEKPVYIDDYGSSGEYSSEWKSQQDNISPDCPSRIKYPNDHEIRIVKQQAILNNMTYYKNYNIQIHKFCELKEKVLDESLSNSTLLETFNTYYESQPQSEILDSIKVFVDLLLNLTEDYQYRSFQLYTINQMLYALNLLNTNSYTTEERTNYENFIKGQLYTEEMLDLYTTSNYISKTQIETDLKEYIINRYFLNNSVLYLKDDDFLEVFYPLFKNSSGKEYYDYFYSYGILCETDDSWISVLADNYSMNTILEYAYDIAHLPDELKGSVEYRPTTLPMFEKVWNKASYYEKKFIQHCGLVMECIGIQPIPSPYWRNISFDTVLSYIYSIVLLVVSIVLLIFCPPASAFTLALMIAGIVIAVLTLIVQILMDCLGPNSPAYKWLKKTLKVLQICQFVVNILTICSGGMDIMQIISLSMNLINAVISIVIEIITKIQLAEIEEIQAELDILAEEEQAVKEVEYEDLIGKTNPAYVKDILFCDEYYESMDLNNICDPMNNLLDYDVQYELGTSINMDFYT